jgi:hypothetical protein
MVPFIEFPFTTSKGNYAFKCWDEGNHFMNFLSSSLWTRWGQSIMNFLSPSILYFTFGIWSGGNQFGIKYIRGDICVIFATEACHLALSALDQLSLDLQNVLVCRNLWENLFSRVFLWASLDHLKPVKRPKRVRINLCITLFSRRLRSREGQLIF